jgi:ABC-type spermidine/putrescine transport system permease subunit II
MDWLMMIPPIVSAVGNLGALAAQAIAEALLTVLCAFVVGGVGVVVVATVAWRSLKRALPQLHMPLRATR